MDSLYFLLRAVRFPSRIKEVFERQYKLRCCTASPGVTLYPTSTIECTRNDPRGIVLGSKSKILGRLSAYGDGQITIGASCYFGEGSHIWSASSVSIGDRVLISHGVNIHDFDSHPISAAARAKQVDEIFSSGHPTSYPGIPMAPIIIEDDVWIGFNSTILKGVHIGKGAVIGAGTMVTKDVEPFSIVVGSPARVVGTALP